MQGNGDEIGVGIRGWRGWRGVPEVDGALWVGACASALERPRGGKIELDGIGDEMSKRSRVVARVETVDNNSPMRN